MAQKTKKTQPLNVRLPNKEMVLIDAYAQEHGINRSQAVLALVRKGLDKSDMYPATAADIHALRTEIQASFKAVAHAIEHQPIAIQQTAPQTLPEARTEDFKRSLFGRRKPKKTEPSAAVPTQPTPPPIEVAEEAKRKSTTPSLDDMGRKMTAAADELNRQRLMRQRH